MIGFICIGFYPVLICENLRLKKIKINFARLLIKEEKIIRVIRVIRG